MDKVGLSGSGQAHQAVGTPEHQATTAPAAPASASERLFEAELRSRANTSGFIRWYRVTVLLLGVFANGGLAVKLGGFRFTTVEAFLLDMVPVLVLVAAARILSAGALLVLTLGHAAMTGFVAGRVIGASSSTAPVAMMLATIASTAFIALAVLVAAVVRMCAMRNRRSIGSHN